MKRFHVWLRPLGNACRVRVDGSYNAMWLMGRLGHSLVGKTSAVLDEERGSPCCTFHVDYSSQMSRPALEGLLAGIPEVELMLEPA